MSWSHWQACVQLLLLCKLDSVNGQEWLSHESWQAPMWRKSFKNFLTRPIGLKPRRSLVMFNKLLLPWAVILLFNHYSFKFLPLHNPLSQAMLRVNPGKLRSNLRKAYTKDRGKHNPTNPKAVCISQNEFSTGKGTKGCKSIRKYASGMLQVPSGFEVLAVKRNENKNSWQDSRRKRLKRSQKTHWTQSESILIHLRMKAFVC